MEAIVERCAGLDVHQASVVGCVLVGTAEQKPRKEVRTFGTMTRDLLELKEWLRSYGVGQVGMESTGVYWKPVYAILEDEFEMVVGNARHIKNVPGRKTDVRDAEWIAKLLRHGLIARSFVPPPAIRELRDLLRYRHKLTQSRTSERNRLLKLLETANIKIASVVSDVFGVSGMAMLRALLQADCTPQQMAQLAKRQLRKKIAQLELALDGKVNEHHRFLLRLQLTRLEQVDGHLAELDERIDTQLSPYREQHRRLTDMPGIDWVLGAVLIAELGTDMTVFKSAKHLASWAGVCPGNHESAGKRSSGKTRKGNVHLTTALVEAANAGIRKKGSYLRAKFFKLKARRGYKRALIAVAHKMLLAAYHVMGGQTYNDLGETYLDQLNTTRTANQLVRRLERLGYRVKVESAA
jgi:transposase